MTAAAPGEIPTAPPAAGHLLSARLRRFSAGLRMLTALLCTVLLLNSEPDIGPLPVSALLAYGLWAAGLLWRAGSDAGRDAPIWHYWIDAAWAVLMMLLLATGTMMLTVTLVHPVMLASVAYGPVAGAALAFAAAGGLLLDTHGELVRHLQHGWSESVPALLALALVPAAALVAHPIGTLRRRLVLIDAIQAQLDPRRGLEPVCVTLAERLRSCTDADVAALVLPARHGAPATMASRGEGGFRLRDDVHGRLEVLLADLPDAAVSYVERRWWDPRARVRLAAVGTLPEDATARLAELAAELEASRLHVVPLTRYGRRHGHCVVAYATGADARWGAPALSAAAPELLRVIEQAALVDQVQEEAASHERARIGRDLHDSAIQPYLGLKYAVECAALRIPPDNPARAEVDALAELVNAEVGALRELIACLRSGGAKGDNILVSAVRRQVRRFALLFGIDVEVDCPDSLSTTRAMADALFHMVNEILGNLRKHTSAKRAWISLSAQPGLIRLAVRDDSGSVRGVPGDADFRPGSLCARVAELDGSLRVTRPDGLNTELVIEVPVRAG